MRRLLFKTFVIIMACLFLFTVSYSAGIPSELFYYGTTGKVPLTPKTGSNTVYLTLDGQEMEVTGEICLQFKKEVPETAKKNMLASFQAVEKIRTQPWEKYFSIITVGKDSDPLTIANKIVETGLVNFAHPNFLAKTERHVHYPNDSYFFLQFYLNNIGQTINEGHIGTPGADINAPEAWDITRGSNAITVAVLDEGVELNNNDLPAARLVVLNGSNFAGGDPNNPAPVGDDAHGTCCAGIIAAEQDNLEGITGVAPLCRIMPVRIPFGIVPASTYANAINFAWSNGADVLSNSWGYNSNADIPVITAAINNAVTMGRGGIGSVVAFSAGNTAVHNFGLDGVVVFPANVAVASVLTVGASDRNDQQANYSPNGSDLDIVAPSHLAYSCQIPGESFEVWSTDIIGTAGYNPAKNTDCGALPPVGEILPLFGLNNLNYTGRFGGTSAACPQVAGLAALILSVHPTFTPAQVFNRIINSADKVGGYTYTNGKSIELGYGRINAFNALQEPASIRVQFYNGNRTPVINTIFPWFKLTNTGPNPLPLSDVKLRYYYTIDGAQPQNFFCDFSQVGTTNVTGQFVPISPPETNADYYLEVGFTSGAGSLAPGASVEAQCRFAKTNWANYTQTNDYSFNATATTYVDWTLVTGFVGGVLQWGTEP